MDNKETLNLTGLDLSDWLTILAGLDLLIGKTAAESGQGATDPITETWFKIWQQLPKETQEKIRSKNL